MGFGLNYQRFADYQDKVPTTKIKSSIIIMHDFVAAFHSEQMLVSFIGQTLVQNMELVWGRS